VTALELRAGGHRCRGLRTMTLSVDHPISERQVDFINDAMQRAGLCACEVAAIVMDEGGIRWETDHPPRDLKLCGECWRGKP
jgi:hypothetical protein